jgi:hypothetical protein
MTHDNDEWGNLGDSEKFLWNNTKLTNASKSVRAANKKRNQERVSKLSQEEKSAMASHRSKHGWDKLTEEQKQKRAEHTGNSIWGTEESRQRQIESIRKAKKDNGYWKGKKHSAEMRKKNSEALKGKKNFLPTHYDLMTPKGIFDNRNEAAEAFGVRPDTISKWITKHKTDEFYWIPKSPDRIKPGPRIGSNVYVYHTPAGVIDGTEKQAAEANGVTVDIVSGRCRSKNYPDWQRIKKS